ncbi:MAG: hypothetical protein IRZ16_07170 [Myxococcaceae bacterium]|nr:hypothetical protein [Myxococcaceae bacterium]
MNNPSRLRLAVLLPLVFASACVIYNNEGGDRPHSGQPPEGAVDCPCLDNSSCDEGLYCLRGECTPKPPGNSACVDSSDCGNRSFCINGYCTELCAKDADCSYAAVCQEGYCTALPATDGGSPHGGGDTGSKDGGSACVQHSDCGVGAYCINAVCYLGCQTNADCPSAEECISNVCHPKQTDGGTPVKSCTTGADCATGEDCVNGACSLPCNTVHGCPAGQTCVIGYCTVSSPPQGSGQSCLANCDCPSGEVCKNGVCSL